MAAVSVVSSALVVTVSHTVFRVMWLFAALEAAWASGFFFSARRTLLRLFASIEEVTSDSSDVPQREALLARLNERAGAYPNLWPIIVPLVATVVTVVATTTATLMGR